MVQTMQRTAFSIALAFGLWSASSVPAAWAQDLTSADNGRYSLLSGSITENGRQVPVILMIDSQTGRTWRLFADDQWGGQWKRMPLVRMDNPPDGMLSRPLPVTPQSGPAAR